MHEEVRVGRLLERRFERLHQRVRQPAHEPDRVGDGCRAAVGKLEAPRRCVERREQLVLHEHACARERVQQCGLPGVGVADECDRRRARSHALGTLHRTDACNVLQLLPKLREANTDAATIGLQLRLSRTARTEPADPRLAHARHRLAPAAKAGKQVVQLRELDLQLPLGRVRVLREDVDDQCSAVDDLAPAQLFQVPELTRRQLFVDDHCVRAGRANDGAHLVGLPFAQERRRIRPVATLQQGLHDFRAGRIG